MDIAPNRSCLGRCHGFHVVADDGLVGMVEQPLVPPDAAEPDYLVVRIGGRRRLRARLPVVWAGRVSGFDSARRILWVRGRRAEIAALPEHLPLAV